MLIPVSALDHPLIQVFFACAMFYALYLIYADDQSPQRRLVIQRVMVVALVLTLSVTVWADVPFPLPDFCTEAHLRSVYGDQWEVMWWLNMCFLLP